MTHYYCSTFSKDYAYKGLLLYSSLVRWDKDFHFFMFCLDDEVEKLFKHLNFRNATIIPLSAVEQSDHQLKEVKTTRSDKEYAWTSKASVMLYILNYYQHTDHIIWLDGDTYFYADPKPIFKEWDGFSILLTEERWRKKDKHKTYKYGRYNTGFMGFKRDKYALECLSWFRDRLVEWCYDKHENGLWSDQLYVNDWSDKFQRVGIIQNIGVNVNPYIIEGCTVSKVDEEIYVDGQKLILYHSYGFKYYDDNNIDLCSYNLNLSDEIIRWIYLPYMIACRDIVRQIKIIDDTFYSESKPAGRLIRNYFNLEQNKKHDTDCRHLCTVLTKDYLVQGLALYHSLNNGNSRFHLWICCIDSEVYELLYKMHLKHATLISLDNIKNERLDVIEKQRDTHEFCWTIKSVFISYLMKNNYALGSILYIDADLFFFQDIKAVYDEWGTKSIYLTRLWLGPRWTKKVGRYSGGLIGFRRDKDGMRCLKWWKRKCLNWCYDRYEENRWSDQKYLDHFPQLCPKIKISQNWGMNAGPWSVARISSLHVEDNTVFIDGCRLVCYHFSGFRVYNNKDLELCNRKKLPEKIQVIYLKYVERIVDIISKIEKTDVGFFNKTALTSQTSKYRNYFSLTSGDIKNV